MRQHHSKNLFNHIKFWIVALGIFLKLSPLNASDIKEHDGEEIAINPQQAVGKLIFWEGEGYAQLQTLKAMACVNRAVADVVHTKRELTFAWQPLQYKAQEKVKRASTELVKVEHAHSRKSRKNSRKRYMQVLINEMMPECLDEMKANACKSQQNHPNLSICLLWIIKQVWHPQRPTDEETLVFYKTIQLPPELPVILPQNITMPVGHISHKLFENNNHPSKKLGLNVLSLSFLPVSLGYLSHITELNLYVNNLDYLPDSFRFLKNLNAIFLSSNHFETFPPILEILCYQNLKYLTLSYNKIQDLPTPLIPALKRLEILKLDGNPLVDTFEKTDKVRGLLEQKGLNLTL